MSQTAADAQVLVILLLLFWVASLAQGSEELSLTGAHHPRDIFPCLGETQWLPTNGFIQNLTEKAVVQLQLSLTKKARFQTLEKPRVHDWATE